MMKPTYANAGARAYDQQSSVEKFTRYTVKLPGGGSFTMLKSGNADGCDTDSGEMATAIKEASGD